MEILNCEEEVKKTVGEEFIEWAEKYWHLDELLNTSSTDDNSESYNYDSMRDIFVEKINTIIKDRL